MCEIFIFYLFSGLYQHIILDFHYITKIGAKLDRKSNKKRII